MTAPWLALQRNGGKPLTPGSGHRQVAGTSHPAHRVRPAGALASPGGKGAARDPLLKRPGGPLVSLARAHTRLCVDTHEGSRGTARAEWDTCDAPLPLGPQPQGTSAVSALQLLAPRAHTRTHTHTHSHTHPIHTRRAQHTLLGPVLRGLPGARPLRCRSSLTRGVTWRPTPIRLSRGSGGCRNERAAP